jgi:hypothetical protein
VQYTGWIYPGAQYPSSNSALSSFFLLLISPLSSSDLRAVIRLVREKSMRRQTFERYKHRRLRASRKEEIPICFGLSVAGVGNNRYAFLSALFDLW